MPKKSKTVWEPSVADYRKVFSEQNPWHGASGEVPHALAQSVERPLATKLWRRLQNDSPRRFHLILGPRRVGKSTVLYQTARHLLRNGVPKHRIWWLRLDHPLLMRISLGKLVRLAVDAAVASSEEPVYLLLDELVYAEEWDGWLKTFYDDNWPVRVAASSSATAALRRGRTESGVGRWLEEYLSPYLFGEFLELAGRTPSAPVESSLFASVEACSKQQARTEELDNLRQLYMLTGGFPELLTILVKSGEEASIEDMLLQSQRILRADAVERAVYKDIPQTFDVDNPMVLERTLYVLAGQFTGILSPKSICQDLGMSQPTFDKYLSYLSQAYLVFTLANYSGSESVTQRRGRKLYFVDGAVRNAALQRGLAPLQDSTEMGMLWENLVAGHLQALCRHNGVRLYHWREKGNEVDLVYDDETGGPMAIEVASSDGHSRKGLVVFSKRHPRFQGRCYLVAPNASFTRPADNSDGVGTLPLNLLLLLISGHVRDYLPISD